MESIMEVVTETETLAKELPPEMFPAGETQSATHDKAGDPQSFLDAIFKHREDSVRSEVATQIAISRGMDAFGKDSEGAALFYQELVRFKVITQALATKLIEGKAPRSVKSKFSKIRRYADQILDPRVLQYLGSAGYSVLYELVQLIEALEETRKADPVAEVSKILEGYDGSISRIRLEEETRKITGKTAPVKTKMTQVAVPVESDPDGEAKAQEQEHVAEDDQLADEGVLTDSQEETDFLEGIAARQAPTSLIGSLPKRTDEPEDSTVVSAEEAPAPRIHIVLATPTSRDASRIRNGETPPLLSELKRELGDQAVLLVHTKLATLISMVAAGASAGFDRFSAISMTTQPATPDVGDCDVLAIFERGETKLSVNMTDWPSEKGPLKLANRLLKDIEGRRVHLFTKTASAGWEALSSDSMWAEPASAS
jgi:hypothetical protein